AAGPPAPARGPPQSRLGRPGPPHPVHHRAHQHLSPAPGRRGRGKDRNMSKGLTVGAVLPDFKLPDDGGTKRQLSELQGDNAMVLQLGRGEHCPRERQQHKELLKAQGWAPVAFTTLVTVLPNNLHDTNKMKIATGAWWTFLSDGDLDVLRTLEIDEYTDPHHAATVPHTLVLAPGLLIDKIY